MPYHLTLTSDFFQPNRTYTDGTPYRAPELVRIFDVELVTRHPDRGHLRAVGWMRTAEPGSARHMQAIDEDEYQPGVWKPYVDTTTLLGHPNADNTGPVLLTCAYSWSCGCDAPALIIYADGPDLETARSAADDAAWGHAWHLEEAALEDGEDCPGSEHHDCGSPRPHLISALRTMYSAAPQVETLPGHDASTVVRVHARTVDGAAS
ncbi:hypothetical protein ABZ502_34140 [Streptomyces abikoensis]|uniref:hypothetical protein n=1 Tax=Streptomyces abikoensis TaxID=97398 RepID=UPI0033EEB071